MIVTLNVVVLASGRPHFPHATSVALKSYVKQHYPQSVCGHQGRRMNVWSWGWLHKSELGKCSRTGSYTVMMVSVCVLWRSQPPTICPLSHLYCNLQETSRNIPLWFDVCSIDITMPNGLLMGQNYFIDFANEHWYGGCHPTEPGYAGDIGAVEILIAWLSGEWILCQLRSDLMASH